MRKVYSHRRVGLPEHHHKADTGLLLGRDYTLTSTEQQSEETLERFVITSTEELKLSGVGKNYRSCRRDSCLICAAC